MKDYEWSERVTFYLEDADVGTPFTDGENNYYLIYSAECRGIMEGVERKAIPWWKRSETPGDKDGEDELTDAEVLSVGIEFWEAYKEGEDVKGRIERAEEPDILLVHKGNVEDRLFYSLKRYGMSIKEYLAEVG